MSDVSYHFDSWTVNPWNTDAGYMVDNILTNFASTSSDGDLQTLNINTCPGANLGTITKVEMRAYAYGDGDDRIDFNPYMYLGTFDIYPTTPGGTPGWGAYFDITTDPTAPSPWIWSDIEGLNVKVIKENVGKGNMMYCAKVEIRVTYTPTTGGVAHSYGFIFG